MKKKMMIILLTVVVASLLLSSTFTGCKEATPEEITKETAEGKTPEEETVSGGELIVRTAEDIENFDTHTDQLQVFRSVIQWTIFEPLVRYDENLELQPVLAESWKNVSDTVWRFNIRQGVKFHDGSDLTAEDVKYSFDRVKDPNTGSWLIGNLGNIVKATVVDEYTLDIELDSPVASFLDKITVIGIIPKGSGDDQKRSPIGTGPFQFVEYSANEHVIVEKFADYWIEGKPILDKITFRPVPETSVALTELEAGDIDLVSTMTASEANAAESITDVELTVQDATTILSFFEVNRRTEPLNDPQVFAALLKCLDREAVGSLVYQGYGTATNVPVSPVSEFYKEIPTVYDPDAAKSELEALGYESGDIKLEIISWGGYKALEDMAVIWKEGLNKAGVDVNVNVLEVQVMLDRYNAHDFDIATNLYAPPPDPDVYYDVIWGPRLADDYVNPEAEELIAKGRSSFDLNERIDVYNQLQELSATNGPCVDVWFEAAIAAQNSSVKGLVITPVNDYDFSSVWIEN